MTPPPLLLSRDAIHDEIWDRCIDNARQRVVYAYSWYLDAVCTTWEALVWPSPDAPSVVMPLPFTRKWGFRKLQQPLFCQFLGLFSTTELTPAVAGAFLDAMNRRYRYIAAYHFNPYNTSLREQISSFRGLQARSFSTRWLPLSGTGPEIRAGYSPDRRSNLRKSRELPWTIHAGGDPGPLMEMFRANHAHLIPGGVDPGAYAQISRLYRMLAGKGMAVLYYALLDDRPEAGIMVITCGDHYIYIFNAATETGRRGNARTFLLDSFFGEVSGRSGLIFDFESPEKKPVADFYKSFGAREEQYVSIRKNGLPFPLKQIQPWLRSRQDYSAH